MKRFVNGVETELEGAEGVEVAALPDRLAVRSSAGANTAVAVRVGEVVHVSFRGNIFVVDKGRARARGQGGATSGEIRAPMPGQIVDVYAHEGQEVALGDKLLVLEAMKTHQSFSAPFNGKVMKLPVKKGDQVGDGELLVLIESAALDS